MKNRIRVLFVALELLLLSAINSPLSTAFAQGTTAFTYNGMLNDGGNPANGAYDVRFTLYDAITNGNAVALLTNTATGITNGLFAATLDFGSVFTGSNYWLELAVRTNGGDAFTALCPRQPVLPVPYATYSATAGNAATATMATEVAGFTGSIADAQLSANVAQLNGTNVFAGTNTFAGVMIVTNANNLFNGTFAGDGSALTNIPLTGLQAAPLTNGQGGVTLNDLTLVSNLSVAATNFVNYLVVSNPPVLDGSAIINLNASQISNGTLALAQLPAVVLTNNQSSVALNGAFAGDGSALTNIPLTGLQAVPLTNGQGGVTLNDLTLVSNLSVAATNFVNYLVVSNPPVLDGSAIINLNASQISNGTLALAQLPAVVLTNNQSSVALNGAFAGDGSALTNIPLTGLQAAPLTNGQGGVTLNDLTLVSNLSVAATNFVNYLVVSNPPVLDGSAIINLNASQISNGTLALAQLPMVVLTNNQGGVALNGAFAGDGSALTNLNPANLSGGTANINISGNAATATTAGTASAVSAANIIGTVAAAQVPVAGTTPATLGGVYADNSTITVGPDGKISSIGGGGLNGIQRSNGFGTNTSIFNPTIFSGTMTGTNTLNGVSVFGGSALFGTNLSWSESDSFYQYTWSNYLITLFAPPEAGLGGIQLLGDYTGNVNGQRYTTYVSPYDITLNGYILMNGDNNVQYIADAGSAMMGIGQDVPRGFVLYHYYPYNWSYEHFTSPDGSGEPTDSNYPGGMQTYGVQANGFTTIWKRGDADLGSMLRLVENDYVATNAFGLDVVSNGMWIGPLIGTSLYEGITLDACHTNTSIFIGTNGVLSANGAGLTNIPVCAITGGLTTNLAVLVPGGGTSTLCFTNGILMNVQ